VCDKTTSDGLPGEKLVINYKDTPEGIWYVATEGLLDAGVFTGRREAFRTQEHFYLPGWHDWQINKESSHRAANWEDRAGHALSAETRIPAGSGSVNLTSNLQLALEA
jgi:hypothetical protein